MLGILRALRDSVAHGMSRADELTRLLEAMRAEEARTSTEDIEEKLRLYDVT